MMRLLTLLSFAAFVYSKNCESRAKRACGYAGIDSDGCQAKGCCWSPAGDNSATPWCYYGEEDANSGYSLSEMTSTATGYTGFLKKIGSGSTTYGPDLQSLKLDVIFETEQTVHIKISDATSTRWEIPQSVIPRTSATKAPASTDYEFTYEESPFIFEVKRKSDGVSVFRTDKPFVFKDQYIELTTTTSSSAKTFGLGESTRLHQALRPGQTYTLWAADVAAAIMEFNLYGSYPYYLQMLNGSSHGAMLLNSNGMDVVLQDDSITFKTIGGIIDLYIFAGPSPAEVVKQYTSVVGKPAMMPYWSLGFHNCKYGYTSVSQVEEVVKNYSAAEIPLDTQWMDIDYMQNYRDFTLDAVNFPQAEVASFVDTLHSNGQHFVPIIDPGIMVYSNYDAYEQGKKDDLFIKDVTGNFFLGQVWPGPVHFPDFLHPKTQQYWTDQLSSFHNLAHFDGLWIDMNEASNFCGSDGKSQVCSNPDPANCPDLQEQMRCCLTCETPEPENSLDFPPYHIRNLYVHLSARTIPASARQYQNVSHYNAHNLYGLTEQIATANAIKDIRGKRPFVLSRSSFLSTGSHSAKWTGDNGASWEDLKSSIVSVMDFNIFGVPMIGADICGFIKNTTEELCARWIEVGAFYTFSRAHNDLGYAPQELYLWPSVAEAARKALALRYRLLPYMYTLFSEAHFSGATVTRPLWMNFPSDPKTVEIDRQFMLGSALLISPVVDEGMTFVDAYFPVGLWYPISSTTFDEVPIDTTSMGRHVRLNTPLTSTNVHVRGGSILPLQEAAMTTTAGRLTPFTLLIALDVTGIASGSLYWDDGEQIDLSNYISSRFTANAQKRRGSISGNVTNLSYLPSDLPTINTIVVLGSNIDCPSAVTINGDTYTGALDCISLEMFPARTKITFGALGLHLTKDFELNWS